MASSCIESKMKNKLSSVFCSLIGLFFLSQTTAFGQSLSEKLKFSRIGVNAGLSNSSVTSIIQDSRGFMWIGTSDGLNRYDGYRFVTYKKIDTDSTGLVSNNIHTLFEDSKGKLWISGNIRGFYYFDRLKEKVTKVPELSTTGQISSIDEDENKTLWVTGNINNSPIVASYSRDGDKWILYQLPLPAWADVLKIEYIVNDDYWLTTRTNGLFKWNKSKNSLVNIVDASVLKNVSKCVKDVDGSLWFATQSGLCKFDPKMMSFKYLGSDSNGKSSVLKNSILDLLVDGPNLWIGTENGGLCQMDIRTESFTNYMPDKADPSSISDKSIWSVYKDRQKRIWVGTFSAGLCIYDEMKNEFRGSDTPLINDQVNAIIIDKKQRLWVGTEGGLTMQQGKTVKHYTNHKQEAKSLPNFPVISTFEDHSNQLWFGMWNGGLCKLNEASNTFTNYAFDSQNESSLKVLSIIQESESNHLLIGTFNGLYVMDDERNGKFTHYIDESYGASRFIRFLFEDSQKKLWVGSISDLYVFDIKTNTRKVYKTDMQINCIAEDRDGTIWVGSEKGLHKFNRNRENTETYTVSNGLPSDIIRSILIDDHGNIWLGSTKGISKFNPKNRQFTNYNEIDGLNGDEFRTNAFFKSKNGELFFGGKGLTTFHPDSIRSNPYVPNIYITSIKVFNKPVGIGKLDSLSKNISEIHELNLPYETDFFTLEYVGLNYTSASKNRYAYKLEGLDVDWVDAGIRRSATFRNLGPGSYIFKVKVSNNEGIWNEEPATFIIRIPTPWWEKTWVKVLSVLIIFATAILISVLRTKNIKRWNRKLQETIEEKTKHIQEQNRVLTEQGEEMTIQNEILQESKEEIAAQRDLVEQQNIMLNERQVLIEQQNQNLENEVIKRTSELVEHSQQLEQFAFISAHNLRAPVARMLGLGQLLELTKNAPKEREDIYPRIMQTARELDSVVSDLSTILQLKKNTESIITDINLEDEVTLICENLEKEIAQTGVTIKTDFAQAKVIQSVKPYIESILYNLISNAIKYRHPSRESVIFIKTEKFEEQVCLRVSDNGLGIDLNLYKEKLFTLYQRFHLHIEGKGMGLYLVKAQTIALGARIEVESEVNKGTTFNIYFKEKLG
jgi:ligand-binding sensor domain-containing protein/signal transduction histidine kinase